ncbi:MAG TPA: hypothetical protein VIM65_06885 [Cyclobacteriaceae bacterium]
MSYKLDPDIGKPISKETAERWIQNHRDKHPHKDEIRARFFGTNIIEEILHQDLCVGIRIYYATSDEGEKQLLLVGTREDGSNIWPDGAGDSTITSKATGIIADASSPCPPYC